MSNDYYHDMTIAQAYDTEHATQAVTVDDISFYSSLATQAAKAGQGVLELGCGTGRVTIPIARAGVNIVGLDVAPEMLAVARNKAG
ncbi:MAG TPA: methyltransferase domain-containing protein, partial [Dehalococcoidia bacterium]|nr:methyltransferase domain-containing protein [Dehalococcoidia bacterium]